MDGIPKTPLHWDWETLTLFSEKDCDVSKHLDLKVQGAIDTSNVSRCSSGGGACSYSELGNGLSKNSLPSSVDNCLNKPGRKMLELQTEPEEKILENMNKNNSSCKPDCNSSEIVSAAGPKEPVIGLKLGKRTYFENSSSGSNMKATHVTCAPASASSSRKTKKMSQENVEIYCQVEGCKTDLTAAKEYHRKHRVCGVHSKSPKVIVAGKERRFCQQCSRFHDLLAFDQKKRSCRRRLSDHNARRRKPLPETISFNSSLLSTPYYDDKHQMNLAFGRSPICYMNTAANTALTNISDVFELKQFKGGKVGGINGEHQFLPALPTSTVLGSFDGLLPYKATKAEVLNPGLESPVGVSSLEEVQDARHALSLLSTDSFGSVSFGQAPAVQFEGTNIPCYSHPATQTIEEPGFWQDQQHSMKQLSCNSHDDNVHFQNFHLQKTVQEAYFFDSNQIL